MTAPKPDRLEGTRYSAGRVIGRGGMGEVFEATHRELGNVVVVKLLHAGAPDPQLAERMRIEAQVVSRLEHPNIVRVLDYGRTPGGEPYLVLERLIGHTLTAELRARKTFTVAAAIDAATALLDALEYAHVRGVVHRDVKLENIFVHQAKDGPVIKLLDFGIAKLRESTLGVAPSAHPTGEGWILGTPRYAAPEQLLSLQVDARTDVYAAGVVLFALLAGRRPFEQKDQEELMRAQIAEPAPRLSSLATQVIPPALDRALERALAKRPADRFESAADFARELRAIRELPEPAPTAPVAASAFLPVAAPRDRRAVEEPATTRLPPAEPQTVAEQRTPPAAPEEPRRSTPGWLIVVTAAGIAFLLLLAVFAALHVFGAPTWLDGRDDPTRGGVPFVSCRDTCLS